MKYLGSFAKEKLESSKVLKKLEKFAKQKDEFSQPGAVFELTSRGKKKGTGYLN